VAGPLKGIPAGNGKGKIKKKGRLHASKGHAIPDENLLNENTSCHRIPSFLKRASQIIETVVLVTDRAKIGITSTTYSYGKRRGNRKTRGRDIGARFQPQA